MTATPTYNPNQAADLKLALGILASFNAHQPESLTLLASGCINDEAESVEVVFPEWLMALSDAFERIYGKDKGQFALTNALENLLTRWVDNSQLTHEIAELYMLLVNSYFHSNPSATRH